MRGLLRQRIPVEIFAAFFLICALTACHTPPALPPADLSQPGWQIRQGQAVWKPPGKRPELSGELLVATKPNGDLFVQFTKTPFPVATAQSFSNLWRVDFGAGNYSFGGRGKPPAYFGWFELPPALAGEKLAGAWTFQRDAGQTWHLLNARTGEKLEGFLSP